MHASWGASEECELVLSLTSRLGMMKLFWFSFVVFLLINGAVLLLVGRKRRPRLLVIATGTGTVGSC